MAETGGRRWCDTS